LVHDGHFAVASKDRTGLFSGDPKPITVDTGKRLADWLAGGLPSPVASAPTPARTADATGGTGDGQPTRGFWLDRVDNSTTVEQLGAIGDDADQAVSAGELSPSQRARLDKEISIKHQKIEPEVTNGVA
jgi:hypothetical protein